MDTKGLYFILEQIVGYVRDYRASGVRVLPLGEAYLPLYKSQHKYNGGVVLHEQEGVLHITGFDHSNRGNNLDLSSAERQFHVTVQVVPHDVLSFKVHGRDAGTKRVRRVASKRLRYENLIVINPQWINQRQVQDEILLLLAVYLARDPDVLSPDVAWQIYRTHVLHYHKREPNNVAFMRLLRNFTLPTSPLALRSFIRVNEQSSTSRWPNEIIAVLSETNVNVHPRTIYNWLRRGDVPCERNGLRYQLTPQTIEAIKQKLVRKRQIQDLVDLATPPGRKRKSTMRWVQRLRQKGYSDEQVITALIERAKKVHNINLDGGNHGCES